MFAPLLLPLFTKANCVDGLYRSMPPGDTAQIPAQMLLPPSPRLASTCLLRVWTIRYTWYDTTVTVVLDLRYWAPSYPSENRTCTASRTLTVSHVYIELLTAPFFLILPIDPDSSSDNGIDCGDTNLLLYEELENATIITTATHGRGITFGSVAREPPPAISARLLQVLAICSCNPSPLKGL